MSMFEIFLTISSIISLSVGIILFYDNYKLTLLSIELVEDKIALLEECVSLYEEIEKLKKNNKDTIK